LKLYEISAAILAAFDQTDDNGELLPGVEERLTELEGALNDKADNIAALMRTCEAEAAAYKTEADRLGQLAGSAAAKADRLKRYLKAELERAGIAKLDCPRFKLAIQKNSVPSVILAAGAEIPDGFARIKRELDTKAVIEAVKAGGAIPDTISVVNGTHLRVR
jgi:hypothetical protein